MSTPEHNGDHVVEQRSSIKIGTTAKGDATVEVKVVEGTDMADLDTLRFNAVETYRQTMQAVRA